MIQTKYNLEEVKAIVEEACYDNYNKGRREREAEIFSDLAFLLDGRISNELWNKVKQIKESKDE